MANRPRRELLLWPLNQLNAVTGRIDREAEDGAAISARARIAGHRSTGGLDRGDGRRHVLHGKNHVGYGVLHVVRVAMKEDHERVLVSLGGFDCGAKVHEDLSAAR